MGFDVILQQITMLGIVMLLGFLGVKTRYITPDLKNGISQVIIKFTLPLLNLTAITGQTMQADMLRNAVIIVLVEVFVIGVLFGLANLVAKLFHLPPATKTIHTLMSTFGNVVFLGYPLITALFGQEGLFYAIVYALVNDGFLWTAGVYMLAKSGAGDAKASFKKLINPNTVAFLVALIMLACGIKLPDVIHEPLAKVGSMTTWLAMLFIGITLGGIPLRGIYKKASIYFIVLVKMLLVPAILIFILSLFPIDRMLLSVLILQVAMPVQTIITVMAGEYHSDYQYAAECVFITTVASLVTLPAIYYFMLQIMK